MIVGITTERIINYWYSYKISKDNIGMDNEGEGNV